MTLVSDPPTNSRLLREVADWENHSAWICFRDTYAPRLRRWCRGYGLDNDSIDEVSQRIWIELADRMKTFEYDPNRTFGGWLRRVCESRVLNFLRQRKAASLAAIDERDRESECIASRGAIDANAKNEGVDPRKLFLLAEGERVQATVRAKIKPHTWDAFWLVAVCDWSVERTAHSLGISKTAVYAARERVARMLCVEGKRVSDG